MERGETLDEVQWINLFSGDLNTIFSASKLLPDSNIIFVVTFESNKEPWSLQQIGELRTIHRTSSPTKTKPPPRVFTTRGGGIIYWSVLIDKRRGLDRSLHDYSITSGLCHVAGAVFSFLSLKRKKRKEGAFRKKVHKFSFDLSLCSKNETFFSQKIRSFETKFLLLRLIKHNFPFIPPHCGVHIAQSRGTFPDPPAQTLFDLLTYCCPVKV